MIRIKRGLNLPIAGSPNQTLTDGRPARSVALLGDDYPGLKPTMEVAVGDRVTAGQLLFTDKKTPGVKFVAPASGTVAAINRGARRAFQSVVIDIEGGDAGADRSFPKFTRADIQGLPRDRLVSQLIDSGEWVSLLTRPFGRIPAADAVPAAIFVTAMDTRPLAPDPQLTINGHEEAFVAGALVMAGLTAGQVFICKAAGARIPAVEHQRVRTEEFAGPHPAGLAGTHIHFLSPVNQRKSVWTIGYQNLIAIGYLFLTGKVFHERVIALSGPGVAEPRRVHTRVGASTIEMTAGELTPGIHRVISGSVLDGRTAGGATAYLGRYANQVSVLKEGTQRELFGFLAPGFDKFSVTGLFLGRFSNKKFALTTSTGGSERAMVPIGTYEDVMPLDILPTHLLRALLVADVDSAIALGCLELDEEDLALCTFVCPGKYEYGPYLRQMLALIEAEG